MAVFNEPSKWQTSLVNSGDANTIPQSTPAGTGEASFEDGFPQITQVPIGAGGIAPDRKDFNGLFKILGDWIFFAQNGGIPAYSTDFDYVAGRVVLYNGNIYKCIQANGASSTVVAPDSVSPLGTDYWVQVATLADFDNFANTDLSNLSATGQALFTNKADKDFSNVTAPVQAFKDMSIEWDKPDFSSVISMPVTNTPQSYICPEDGFVSFDSYASTTDQQASELYINGVRIVAVRASTTNFFAYANIFIPVSKGDSCQFQGMPSTAVSTSTFKFYPCKGV